MVTEKQRPPCQDKSSCSVEKPVFLVGTERSGSTLLRLMLDHHPDIAFEHEFDYVVDLVSDDGTLPSIAEFYEILNKWRGFDYRIDRSLNYRDLVNDFLVQKKARSGKTGYVGATLHRNFNRLTYLWPDARFIHLIRDPRDVTRSVVQKGWAGNLYHGAEWWINAELCWDSLESRLSTDRFIDARYEDLVARPEDELLRICEWIGVSFDPEMLEYQKTAIQYPKPNPALAYQWKKKLSRHEVAVVDARIGNLITQRGYELGPLVEPPAGRLMHNVLMLDSKTRRLRGKIEDLGVTVVCLDLIGRHLHIKPIAEFASRRIREINERHIRQEAAGLRSPSANISAVVDTISKSGNSPLITKKDGTTKVP